MTGFRPLLSLLAMAASTVAIPATAADNPDAVRRIRVVATGIDRVTPEVARLSFTARGEGRSADEAMAAVSTSLKAITAALGTVKDGRYTVTVGDLSMTQVRDKACDQGESYRPQAAAFDRRLRDHRLCRGGPGDGAADSCRQGGNAGWRDHPRRWPQRASELVRACKSGGG